MNAQSMYFASPARRVFFAVGRSCELANRLGRPAKWIRNYEGKCYALADIAAQGVDRFLRCRTDWHLQGGTKIYLFDPVNSETLGNALREQFRIETCATDFGLRDMEFSCGDEVILAVPRKKRKAEGPLDFEGDIRRCYRLRAVRFGCPRCMAAMASGGGPDYAGLLGAVFGRKPKRSRKEPDAQTEPGRVAPSLAMLLGAADQMPDLSAIFGNGQPANAAPKRPGLGGLGDLLGGADGLPGLSALFGGGPVRPDLAAAFGSSGGRPTPSAHAPGIRITVDVAPDALVRILAGVLGRVMNRESEGGEPKGNGQ